MNNRGPTIEFCGTPDKILINSFYQRIAFVIFQIDCYLQNIVLLSFPFKRH